jgi:hypothetical protein
VGEFPASQKRWFLDGDTVTLYHGTSKENLENVTTSGLKGDAEGLVYTSPDVHSATGYASVKGGEAANLKGRPKLNIGDENRITLKYEIPKNEFLKLVGDPDKTQRSLTSKKKLFGKDSKELYNKTKDESASNYYEATEIRFKEGDIDKYLVGAVERVRTPKSQNLNLNQADPDIATANSIIENPKLAEEWKSQNSVKQKQKQNPELQKAANDLLDGKITGKQFREKVKTVNPIVPIGKVPPIPSFTDIVGSLLKKQVEKGIYGLNKEIPDGTRVSSRLDIPAYERYDKWIVSIHDSFHKGRKDSIQGEAIAYGKTIVLNNVSFKSLPSRGLRIAAGAEKNTIGRIFGDIKNEAPESVASRAKRHLNEDEWSEIGFNPYRHGFFYNKATGLPVATADEVVQIGPLVLARNAKKMTISEMKQTGAEGLPVRAGKPIEGLKNLKRTKTLFKKGGTIMKEQMELFQEGGLQEEGGTVDPVSGNEVPIGSTKEEVRDDIPAQLSEGEFVFPADVVRFIGLEKLMQLRQEAKAGLKKMEEMGQMGNSDEATLPDDIPFTVDDLDTREETEEEKVEMARGGVIQAQAGTFVNPNFGTFTRPSYVAPQFQMNQTPISTLPNTQQLSPAPVGGFTPTFYNVTPKPQTGPGSTFQDLIGRRPGQYDEFRKYVNESGMILNIPFKDGEPLYPVPEGYIYQDPEEVIVDDPSVVDVKPQTTRVTEPQSDDGGDPEISAGLGGARTSIGGIDYAVQYDFKGNVTGIANVADALKSGRANFEKPTFEVASLISDQNKAQRGMLNPYTIATGKADEAKKAAIEATTKLSNIKDPISFTRTPERPDVLDSRKDTEKTVEKEAKGKLEQDPFGIGKLGEFDTRDPTRGGLTEQEIDQEPGFQSLSDEAADIAGAGAGTPQATMSPQEAQQKGIEMGFESHTVAPGTATNQAIAQAETQGDKAAPPGSQYSANGKFSSPEPEQSSDTGGGKSIVCTEMYRQTQLEDWSQAMKTWYVYQKKYLTNTHQIGYHWLFKPFVSGMKVNNTLTNVGAYLAKKRTQHLKHILTKGKAKDSLVGNIFCKIIHPIVYVVGLCISK